MKQAVKRNIERFPNDFTLMSIDDKIEKIVSQFMIPSKQFLGSYNP